jgi:hypothetical protein
VPVKRSVHAFLLFAAALLMAFSAYISAAVSVPHLREDLLEIDVRPTLVGAIMTGLHFATFAMVGFAALVLAAGIKALRSGVIDKVVLGIVGLIYLAFGIAAFIWSGSHHTLGYVLIGLLLLSAAVIP